jgi:RNA polymerase sigma factor (sigma-70 family)
MSNDVVVRPPDRVHLGSESLMSAGGGEDELVARLRAGDREALTVLFERYADRLYQHCFRKLGDYADAEDAVSTVFLTLWHRRRRIQVHDGSAAPWMYGVATNVCRNLDRGRRRHLRAVARWGSVSDLDAPDPAEQVTDRLADEQRMRELLDQVRRLSRGEQDVLALVVWSGLSYEHAAAALDIPVGTVRSRLSRARARLGTPEGA